MDDAPWVALSSAGGALLVFGLLFPEAVPASLRYALLLAGVAMSAYGFLKASDADERGTG